MERQILLERADELKKIVNNSEKHEFFHIDAYVEDKYDNTIFVVPAPEYYDTLFNYDKVLAWAELNDFCVVMTVSPKKQPCLRLVNRNTD